MKAITCQIDISSMIVKDDDSVRFSATTPELADAELLALRQLKRVHCEMWLKPLEEVPEEIITINKDLETKSQSQRIRACLYILFKQNSESMEWEQYYKSKTDKYIDWLKQKIED